MDGVFCCHIFKTPNLSQNKIEYSTNTQKNSEGTSSLNRRSILIFIGLALLCGGQIAMFRNPKNDPIVLPWVIAGAGFILFFVGSLPILKTTPDDLTATSSQDTPLLPYIRRILLAIGVGLMLLTTLRAIVPGINFWEQLATWGIGIGLLVISVRGDERPTISPDLLIFALLTLAALVIRVTNLNNMPNLMDQDEALFAMDGVNILTRNFAYSPFMPSFHSHPILFQGLIGASISVFGQNFAGARMVSAVMGSLGIGATYLLGKELFNRRIAVFAALFMLAWPFHFLFARIAMNQPADPLFTTLAAFWFLRGLRQSNGRDFVLAGVMAAIAQLFYLGGRLIMPVFIAYLIFMLLRDPGLVQRRWRGIALTFVSFAVVALPQHFYLLYYHMPISTRAFVNVFSDSAYLQIYQLAIGTPWEQFYRSFGGLFSVPDASWYGASSNLMLFTGGILLLIGASVCLRRLWHSPRYAFPLGWAFSIVLLGSTFSVAPPQYQRYYPGVAPLALLVGIGGVALADVIAFILRRENERRDLAYGLAGLVCVINFAFLVMVYIPERGYFNNRANETTNKLGWMVRDALDEGKQVVVVRNPIPRNSDEMQFLSMTPELFISNGVGDTDVVKFLASNRARRYAVQEARLPADNNFVDYTKPYAIFAPLIDLETIKQMTMMHPDGEAIMISLESDGNPTFLVFQNKAVP